MPSRLVPTVATKFLWVSMAPFYRSSGVRWVLSISKMHPQPTSSVKGKHTYRLTGGAGSVADGGDLVSGGRQVLARELGTEGLNLVKVIDLDALLCTPGTKNLCGRGGAGDGDGIVKSIHANNGLELGKLLGVLEQRGDMVGCI